MTERDIKEAITSDLTAQVIKNHEELKKLALKQMQLIKELTDRGYKGEVNPQYILRFTEDPVKTEKSSTYFMCGGGYILSTILDCAAEFGAPKPIILAAIESLYNGKKGVKQ